MPAKKKPSRAAPAPTLQKLREAESQAPPPVNATGLQPGAEAYIPPGPVNVGQVPGPVAPPLPEGCVRVQALRPCIVSTPGGLTTFSLGVGPGGGARAVLDLPQAETLAARHLIRILP